MILLATFCFLISYSSVECTGMMQPTANAKAPTSSVACACGYVGQMLIRTFNEDYYKFEPSKTTNNVHLVLFNGKLDTDLQLMVAINVTTPPADPQHQAMMKYSVQYRIKSGGKESRVTIVHHNIDAYPVTVNGQNDLMPHIDSNKLFEIYPLGLVTPKGQGSKTFFFQPNSKQKVLAELEIEPWNGNVYFIVRNEIKSAALSGSGLCGKCDGKPSTLTDADLRTVVIKCNTEVKADCCPGFKIQTSVTSKAKCATTNSYCAFICSKEMAPYCGDKCALLYDACVNWIAAKGIHTCALIQHVVAEAKRKGKYIQDWQSKAYCYADNNPRDYMGCKEMLKGAASYMEMPPTSYKGCRGPLTNFDLNFVIGTGCYCPESSYEYTSGQPYCMASRDQCKCATTIQTSGEWYLLETKQSYMKQNCKEKCVCLSKDSDAREYFLFQCEPYTMPQATQCITQRDARAKTSFPADMPNCCKSAIAANKFLFNMTTSQQIWCAPGYKGCPMLDDKCSDVDECTMMNPLDTAYRPPLKPCVNADCKNTEGGYECVCKVGFEKSSSDNYTCNKIPAPTTNAPMPLFVAPPTPAPPLDGPCAKKPCSDNADCSPDWRRLCNVSCACKLGFSSGNTGFQCERPCLQSQEKFCTKSMTQLRNMKCILNETMQPICVCMTGFKMDEVKKECVDMDECAECKHQCVLHSKCTNLYGSYECKCEEGFYGYGIDECKDIDECEMGTYQCDPNADCSNKIPGYDCICKLGWRGKPTSKGTMSDKCVDTDECLDPTSCGEYTKCENSPGSYQCNCLSPGYRKINMRSCEDINECVDIQYQKPPCHPFASCQNLAGNYSCSCKKGFVGDGFSCEADKSTCSRCDAKTTECVLAPEKTQYLCQCRPEFNPIPMSNTQCVIEPKCQDPTKNDCDKVNAICQDNTSDEKGYKCKCKSGYTGDGKSCKLIDPCQPDPCTAKVNSVCKSNQMGTYSCECKPNYRPVADKCVDPEDIKVSNCSQCDAVRQECVKDTKNADNWKCTCKPGYCLRPDGFFCSNCDECANNADNDCDNLLANCIDKDPQYDNGAKFECKCKPGYEGSGKQNQCKDIDECKTLKTPCPNPHTVCVNTIGSYQCDCEPGWELLYPNMPQPAACRDMDECAQNKAPYRVNCFCVNTEGSYTYKPLPGFKTDGDKCVDVDECLDEKGQPSTVCNLESSTCTNTPGSFFCSCKRGYRAKADGSCQEIDYCSQGSHNCSLDREVCTKIPGSFRCDCKTGFYRNATTTMCEDVNECENTTSPCPQYSNCYNVVGSYYCKCRSGFISDPTSDQQKPSCKPENICEKDPKICGYGVCTTTMADPFYQCKCTAPAIQLNPTYCAVEQYCQEPQPYACPSNTTCEGQLCRCPLDHSWIPLETYDLDGFKKRKGCQPIDPCKVNNPCFYGQTCIYLSPGKSQCTCPEGFQVNNDRDKGCIDVVECVNKTIADTCTDNSECANTIGSYKCMCKKGYVSTDNSTTDKPKCKDNDECQNPMLFSCGLNQHCINDPGSYHCECDSGYEPISTNPLQCVDKNECLPFNATLCDSNANCINTPGSYYCQCKQGFTGDGKTCKDIDECDPAHPLVTCSFREVCKNLIGSYECACIPGLEKSSNGQCINIDECANPQLNNCSTFGVKVKKVCHDQVPGFSCHCPHGYQWNTTTSDCDDINECIRPSFNNCTTYDADCNNLEGSFECNCRRGYERMAECSTSKFCSCRNIDECKNATACGTGAVCVDTMGSYNCLCNPGYVGNPFKECKPFNACIPMDHKCGTNQKCTVITDKAACICEDFHKFIPNFDNTQCLPNPCSVSNGGCIPKAYCMPKLKENKYEPECKCPRGFQLTDGIRCEPVNPCGCEKGVTRCISTLCPTNSFCYYTGPGQHICKCKSGYQNKPTGCEDIDECTSSPCSAGATCKNLDGSYECICPKGQIRNQLMKCRPDLDCSTQQFCDMVQNSFCAKVDDSTNLCQCKVEFIGDPAVACVREEVCKTKKDICSENEVCVDTSYGHRCDCNLGFYRDGSGKCANVDECKRAGTCDAREDCTDTIGSYYCNCSKGYRKVKDECVDINECDEGTHTCNLVTERCQNNVPGFTCACKYPQYTNVNGKCVNNDECKTGMHNCPRYSICTDTEGSFNCTCLKGFKPKMDATGALVACEDEDECDPSYSPKVCDINANCRNTFGGYYCRCKPDFYGSGAPNDCYEVKTCTPECDINAYCVRNSISVFNCTCKPGFFGDGKQCKEINECLDGTHKCHKLANCTKTKMSYYCTCNLPYQGDGKNYCNKINYCQKNWDDCPFAAECKDLDTPMPGGQYFTCICPKGFMFNETNRKCLDVDECQSSPCPSGATCKNTHGSYVCICPSGFEYVSKSNASECKDIDECGLYPFLCKPHGTCKNTPGSFECICDKGFYWNDTVKMCLDINECLTNEHQCNLTTSYCVNFMGSYSCNCKQGFRPVPGSFPRQCEDKEECLTGENNCCHYANCTNTFGSFICTCIQGFTGDGVTCDQIPTCKSEQCGANAYCKELPAGDVMKPTCFCQPGYEGDAKAGCTLIPMCVRYNQPCGKGECSNIPMSYKCKCDPGYEFDGKTCIDVNECLSSPCGQNAVCSNSPGSYSCDCIPGYTGGAKVMCSPIDRCTTTDAKYKMVCSLNGYCKNNLCYCKEGFNGDGYLCTDDNECARKESPCNYWADCENTVGSYKCTCKTGFSGDGLKCTDVDECSNTTNPPCDTNAQCINTQGSFACICFKGWDAMADNVPPSGRPGTCTNVNECLNQNLNICDKTMSTCKDLLGDYECTPNRGYTFKDNPTDANPNNANPNNANPNNTNPNNANPNNTNPNNANPNNAIGNNANPMNTQPQPNFANKYVRDIDECTEIPIQNRCNLQISQCYNTIGSYYCQCSTGYTNTETDRIKCDDIDECKTKPCHVYGSCNNTLGSFKCSCLERYEGDGFNCTAIDVCKDMRYNSCNETTTSCIFQRETATSVCQCKQGFQPSQSNPNSCCDINECDPVKPRHNCNVTFEKCKELFGSFECECVTGYRRNPKTGNCDEIDECIEAGGNSFCAAKSARCKDKLASYECVCDSGFRDNGNGCENINECAERSHNCTFQQSICYDLQGSFRCDCMEPYIKARFPNGTEYCKKKVISCKKMEDCPKNSTCTNMGICTANPGFEIKRWGNGSFVMNNGSYVVGDIDECANSADACGGCDIVGLACKNTIGSFSCVCPSGAEVDHCQCLDLCNPSPCHWGRTCYVDGVSISCQCRSYSRDNQKGDNIKDSVCMKSSNGGTPRSHYDKYAYFNEACQLDDDCALPSVEGEIQFARDFNYFGPCRQTIEDVKCEMGVKPTIGKDYFPYCVYKPE